MHNLLLNRFPREAITFWGSRLVTVHLEAGTELHAPHQPVRHVYFPTSAVVAVVHEAGSAQRMAVALIGRAGLVGSAAILDPEGASSSHVVVAAGRAFRLEAGHLLAEFERSAQVRQLLLGWVQVELTQVVRAATCQRFHTPEQRLCLRLTQIHEELGTATVTATQEQLAWMIGARREQVNQIVGRLQDEGLIGTRRGSLTLLDERAVSLRACACHGHWQAAVTRATQDDA